MTKPLSILFTQAQTYYAADARIHGTLMRYLDRDAFAVHAAVNVGRGAETPPGLRALQGIPDLSIHPMRFPPSAHLRSRLAIARDLAGRALPIVGGLTGLVRYTRRNRIDIIHCLDKARDTAYGLMAARLSGARLVIHMHVKIADWISPVVRRAMRHADGLIAISQFVRQTAIDAGYADQRIHVVLNGLDLADWELPPDSAGVRQEFAIAADAPFFLAVSRLFRWKGHEALLRAFALALPRMPEARLLIVGADDITAGGGMTSYRAELEALTRHLGIARQVVFAGERADVARLMAAADIFALPSFEEPFGMVFLEAMALHRPVVALDNGGAREIVRHGITGLLAAPGDLDGLAAHLALLAHDRELRRHMGAAGRQRLEAHFTAQRMTSDMQQVYRRLAKRAGAEDRDEHRTIGRASRDQRHIS